MNLDSRAHLPAALIVLLSMLPLSSGTTMAASDDDGILARQRTIAAPSLLWQRGGCYASWCETGWYSSPAVADLDGDGSAEVIASAYSIVALDGATGALEWRVASGHDRSEPSASSEGRTWPGIGIADVDGDGALEIVTAHGGGWVSVYSAAGFFESGWPQRPTTSELRGLAIGDVDGDGTDEILVSAAIGSATNSWMIEHTGVVRAGWPQLATSGAGKGYAWGVYNDNAALADLDGDSDLEIVVPSDVHYIMAYQPNGAPLVASSHFGTKVWGEVGVWVSQVPEERGWGACDGTPVESWRTNFASGAATVVDLDHDGTPEVVATGHAYDCSAVPYLDLYNAVHIFEADRRRFKSGSFDWSVLPTGLGLPLSEDYGVIENVQPNPVVADLDGDGFLEILFPDFSGKMHAFWLDGTEHGSWPYSVYSSGEGFFRFAGEPVVVDLDGDGRAEVLFASWSEKGSGAPGQLHVVDALGNQLHELSLPLGPGPPTWGGALAAPTLAQLDGDADLELVLQTADNGVVAYDLPGSALARVWWGTGRGSYLRNGTRPLLFSDGFELGELDVWSSQ